MADLLNEAMADAAQEAAAGSYNTIDEEIPFTEGEAAAGVRFSMPDLSFLLAPTGSGAIDNYIDHPLNYDNERSTARILRGLTGLAGSLDYAIIDIGLGVIEKIQKGRLDTKETFRYKRDV